MKYKNNNKKKVLLEEARKQTPWFFLPGLAPYPKLMHKR